MKQTALISSLAVASLVVGGLVASVAHADDGKRPQLCSAANDHIIELAICLDTSGSMDGLINSARQKLWTIVNDLAKAEPTPTLRVALLSYGNDGNNAENGWVKVETPFTEDLDTVSQMLFGLTTNGGTELVGRVVQTSIEELDWHDGALRMIFVAGNESADQDEQVSARTIFKQATERGIDVNSIYCVFGDDDSEIQPGWRELARVGNGEFARIDQNNGSVVIATEYDQRLIKLSADLNETYIPLGAAGAAGCSNQVAQDANAVNMNTANAASRAATKAGKLYTCGWDLVDGVRNGKVDLAKVDKKDLPENLQSLTHAQLVAKVEGMQQRRVKIQQQILELDKLRQALLMREIARQAKTNIGSFDIAIRTAMRKKAEVVGFQFPPMAVAAATETAVAEPVVAESSGPAVKLVSHTGKAQGFAYFVQFASSSMTTWVSNDLADDYKDAYMASKNLKHDVHIIPGSPEAEAFLKTLPTNVRELIRTLNGAIFLRWNAKTYLLTGGC